MIDHYELRMAAAAAAENPGQWFEGDHWQLREGDLAPVDLAFIGAASPDVVLALTAEVERLEADNRMNLSRYKSTLESWIENWGSKSEALRDTLKHELAALSQETP